MGQSIGGIIHELKIPLSVIKGAVYLIKDIISEDLPTIEKDFGDIKIASNEIEENVDYSLNVINIILEFSRYSKKR